MLIYNKIHLKENDNMKEYTPKEKKELEKNPYTLKVTKYKLLHTAKFKEEFWISY